MRERSPLVDCAEGDCALRLKSVPPALGTRTYWACPPGRVGMPKRQEWMHLHVKPMRQKLGAKDKSESNRDEEGD